MFGSTDNTFKESNSKIEWDKYYLKQLEVVKEKSKDPSTKVAAIIVGKHNQVISQGFNGFPIGINDNIALVSHRYERPLKYSHTLHAEQNALMFCTRTGIPTDGCRMYVSLFPCTTCANLIVQAGIKEIITYKITKDSDRLNKEFNFDISKEIFKEAGVNIIEYD